MYWPYTRGFLARFEVTFAPYDNRWHDTDQNQLSAKKIFLHCERLADIVSMFPASSLKALQDNGYSVTIDTANCYIVPS